MNAKKFLSAITSAAVGLSMLLGSGVTQAFASVIDTDAFTPVRHSNQTVTTTISGDSAETTTTATTTGIYTTTTTAVTTIDYNGIGYPYSGEKVISVNIVDEATGYSIYGDIDVTARLLTSEDINNDTEGVEIASWNLDEENTQPCVLTVPYTVDYEGQMLFIGVYIDNYTDIAYNDIQETLLVFEPLCDDASFMYEVPLEKSYVTTLAPLDYCECCGKDLELGEGIRSPLGLYICRECDRAGLGGTTTAPAGTTIAPISTTTTNHGEGTGTTTTTTTTTTVTTLNTHTTPSIRICDGCGYGMFEYNGTITEDGLFYCYQCVEDGVTGTLAPQTTTTTSEDIGCVSSIETQTTLAPQDYCDCCGADIPEGEGVRTPLGLFICGECERAGAGGTTPPPMTTTTTATTTPISTTDGIYTTTTTTTNLTGTTVTPSTTIQYDYRTIVSYDKTEIAVGETIEVRFYHPNTMTGTSADISEASENISYEYVEGTNVIYITALAAGEAKLYIRETSCAFGAYVNITVTEETEEGTSDCIPYEFGDADMDGQVKMNDVIMVLCYSANPTKFPLNDEVKQYCDVYQTGDGVDISDALEMQKYVAQVITEFSVEK